MLRRSTLEVFSWLETACYKHFSERNSMLPVLLEEELSCCEAFCTQKTAYSRRVLRRKSVVN